MFLLGGIPLLAPTILATLPRVCLLVGLQLMLEQEPLAADQTFEGPLLGVRPHVVLQVVLEDEGVTAEWADVGALPQVRFPMLVQASTGVEDLAAGAA